NINDAASIKTAAASVAKNLLTYYTGTQPGQTPGILPGPPPAGDYYWWEAGAMWNTLIDYWRATGDATYNDLVAQGILFQIGPGDNFMPPNQTASLGNDDQGIWGMAALAAAETGLSNPSDDPRSQWLVLARNVFDDLAARWDDSDSADQCGGGLRWQIAAANQGYDYKNSMSTGTLFNLAVRLARLTGNATYYGEWAERTWGWMETVGFLDKETGAIYDGAHVQNNCSDVNRARFSYVLGTFVQGAANMYNATDAGAAWRDRLSTLVNGTDVFTGDDCVPVESACEAEGTCTTDMRAFKGILLRGLAVSAAQAPFTAGRLGCVLEGAATAVAASCDDAGDEGARCGFVWTEGRDDGARGAGEQMNALAALAA
ncbi:glycoside hydrolase, partial [Coniochaeta ligniaria NRRL 30616]